VHPIGRSVFGVGSKLKEISIAFLPIGYYQRTMVTISLKVSENLSRQLEQEAKQSSRSKSEVIREALKEKFESKKKKRTMGDALRECGGFFEGPEDLSTNPKFMEGFGE